MSLRRKKKNKRRVHGRRVHARILGCLSHIFNILTQEKDFFLPQIKPNKSL